MINKEMNPPIPIGPLSIKIGFLPIVLFHRFEKEGYKISIKDCNTWIVKIVLMSIISKYFCHIS